MNTWYCNNAIACAIAFGDCFWRLFLKKSRSYSPMRSIGL